MNSLSYYTPNISEFYVGFECEWQSQIRNEAWNKQICDIDLVNIAYDAFEHSDKDEPFSEQFRVKYLNREDIESFGFVYLGTTIDNWYTLIETRVRALSNFENRMFRLQHDFRTNQGIVITGYEYESIEGGEVETLYRGSCKNINDLRTILTDLGILL